jgi:hypothetical protein
MLTRKCGVFWPNLDKPVLPQSKNGGPVYFGLGPEMAKWKWELIAATGTVDV